MIVCTPLSVPALVPDSWDDFWHIWNSHSGDLFKRSQNWTESTMPVNTTGIWQGLDIYATSGYPAWSAPFYDIKDRLPKMHEAICKLPFPNLTRVRLLSSKVRFLSHSDDGLDSWAVRGLFHSTSSKSQWYFTRPQDINGTRTYLNLPEGTMWFAFNDRHCWHGTDFDPEHRKILVQIFYSGNIDGLVNKSIEQFRDHTINYN